MAASGRGPGEGNPALGFHVAILFLLGMLFLLVAGVVGLFLHASRGVAVVAPSVSEVVAGRGSAGKAL